MHASPVTLPFSALISDHHDTHYVSRHRPVTDLTKPPHEAHTMHALLVAGARPNFMKVAPVLRALETDGASTTLVHSGQHYDAALSDVFFSDLGLRAPDHHLGAGSGTHAEQTARIMLAFEPVIEAETPDVVIVFGDVNSTVACGLVAAKGGVLLAHVEAGLRSRDWTMPEEVNRVVTDRLSDFLFAPSPDAVDNLRAEGYREDQIHLSGNVMVDCLLDNLDRARERPILDELGLVVRGYGLVTLHRPSNVDDPEVLSPLLEALGDVAGRIPLVFPAHPRTRPLLESLGTPPGITVIPPAGYLDFVALEAAAALVLTDSGGVQEETTVLGVPCLTLRENTERPITIEQGSNRLVGTDREAIVFAASEVLDTGRRTYPCPALWDGGASRRISEVLGEHVGAAHPRPTETATQSATRPKPRSGRRVPSLDIPDPGAGRRSRHPLTDWPVIPGAAAVIGAFLTLFADQLVELIASCIPLAATVYSKGTFFPKFIDVAPTIIGRTGLVLMAAALVAALPAHRLNGNLSVAKTRVFAVFLLCATAVWFGWLSFDHNAFPSNSRIHWVDYFVPSSRTDNFGYALIRIPHYLFYENPYIWQSLNATANAGILFLIARRIGLTRLTSLGAASTIAVSGNLLVFADTSEDLLFNFGLIALLLLSLTFQKPVWIGVCLALATLGRPQLMLLVPCVLAGEALTDIRHHRSLKAIRWPYLVSIAVTTAVLISASQVLFTVIGDRYLFVDGHIITSLNFQISSINVDGFLIDAFSGSYLWHFLWIFPAPIILGALASLWFVPRLDPRVQALVHTAAFGIVALLILSEAIPLLYFNVRYLTYLLPFLLVMAWSLIASVGKHKSGASDSPRVRVLLTVCILLSPVVIPSGVLDGRRIRAERIEYELLAVRNELRTAAAESEQVVLVEFARGRRNFVAYALRDDVRSFVPFDPEALPARSLVIGLRDSELLTHEFRSTASEVVSTKHYVALQTGPGVNAIAQSPGNLGTTAPVVPFVALGTPDAPSWVSATTPSTSGSYVLDWAKPANNGDTIDQYHLQMYTCPSTQTYQGQEFIVGESAHQFTWTGATHGMTRKFRVRAQNAAGWGPFSAWSGCLSATTPETDG